MKQDRCIELFFTFFKIGAFTFGGGYAMIPLIEKEVVDQKKWITKEDILEVVAIAESTPGPIAVNAATFVGFRVAGLLGAFAATLGVILPSFVIISIIAAALDHFAEYEVVQAAFRGIRVGVLALILKAMISMYKQMPKKMPSYIVMLFAFCGVTFLHWNILLIILLSAIFGLITYLYLPSKNEKEGK